MATMISIQLLFFASAREAVHGLTETTLQIPEACDTHGLRTLLAETYPSLASLVLNPHYLTLAVNQEYVVPGQVVTLHEGDVVALIPPISGG